MKKISILHENLQSMKASDYYRDVIVQPAINRKVRAAVPLFTRNSHKNQHNANVLTVVDLVCCQRNGDPSGGGASFPREATGRSVGLEGSHPFSDHSEPGKRRAGDTGYTIYI